MGFFEDVKVNKLGQKAYNTHVQANDLNRRGRPSEAREKYDEALRLYGEAYAAGCRKTGVLMSYSVLLMRNGEFERARELMKEISKDRAMTEDTHFELRVNYSICLWRLGILDKAIETIEYAGKHAKNSSYYSSLGTFLVEQAGQTGEFDAAQILLDEAMDYDDEDAATLDNYGELMRLKSLRAAERGEAEAAKELRAKSVDYYERAHKAKPSQITTLYALARFAREDGDLERARELVDKAILHSGSKVCPVSLEELQALRAQLG